ncbi:MAG: HAMP domain-containing histidine kinase, partial [Bdellovibrionales bacterium]|nr:HAMP domain-containing histidine kinase [Bdellovibrionales bacterium]
QLSQRRKMDALGTLVGGLAHELGTPLNSILLLADAAAVEPPEPARKKLQLIGSQARRCGDLVALLLGYSSGTAASQSREIRWEELIQSCFAAVKGDASVALFTEVAPGIETAVVPELAIRQILENLLRNAVQATQGRPQAGVRVQVELDRDTDEYEISVQDNGPGFSEEARERAFEAFFTTKGPLRQGTGLGLYVVYHMVHQIGGRISISDAMEQGAKIVVRVPADDSKRPDR